MLLLKKSLTFCIVASGKQSPENKQENENKTHSHRQIGKKLYNNLMVLIFELSTLCTFLFIALYHFGSFIGAFSVIISFCFRFFPSSFTFFPLSFIHSHRLHSTNSREFLHWARSWHLSHGMNYEWHSAQDRERERKRGREWKYRKRMKVYTVAFEWIHTFHLQCEAFLFDKNSIFCTCYV